MYRELSYVYSCRAVSDEYSFLDESEYTQVVCHEDAEDCTPGWEGGGGLGWDGDQEDSIWDKGNRNQGRKKIINPKMIEILNGTNSWLVAEPLFTSVFVKETEVRTNTVGFSKLLFR